MSEEDWRVFFMGLPLKAARRARYNEADAQREDKQQATVAEHHYRGYDWPQQRERARERDGYRCRRCGLREEKAGYTLPVHHITPYRLTEDNRLINLVTLCRTCHGAVERGLALNVAFSDFLRQWEKDWADRERLRALGRTVVWPLRTATAI